MTGKVITIVGVGLLGGSYAMGLSKAGNTVYGIDVNEDSIDFAIKNNYIKDGAVKNYAHFLNESDIIVICTYPTTLITWLEENIHEINQNAIITDVCGVKRNIVKKAQKICLPHSVEYYSSHPMRGKEVSGVENADSAIFKNANFILTPSEENTENAEKIIVDMAKTLGFTTICTLSPYEHDLMIGYLSQLTHAIAVSLMTANESPNLVDYSGDSFRDLTRIAKIEENLWSELFIANKDLLCDEIDVFTQNLQRLKGYIKNEDADNMKEMFKLSTKRRKLFDIK